MQTNRKILILLLLILAVAVFFRFWQLEKIPPGLYPDVAINGNDALHALKTGQFKVFYPENNGREGLFINLIALSFWLFGTSILAIKVVPATIGVLTVLGLYLLTRELFKNVIARRSPAERDDDEAIPTTNSNLTGLPRRSSLRDSLLAMTCPSGPAASNFIALLSAFFLAISFWHVNFSRLGFRAIMVPFCLVWSFYFLFRGLNAEQKNGLDADKKIGNWILAGIFFGLGFYTYIAFRIAPLILVPAMFFGIVAYWPRFKSLWKERLSLGGLCKQVYIKDGWWRWDVFFAVIILVALPLLIYFFHHPQDFLGRTGQVSIFTSPNPLKELAVSTVKTLGQFVVWGDTNWRHNIAGSPQIFWPLIPVFLVGLIYSLAQVFKKQNYHPLTTNHLSVITTFWTLLAWWGVMLLPSVLTSQSLPHALRSIGAIPPSYIFVGLGSYLIIKWLWLKIKNRQTLVVIYSLLLVGLVTISIAEYYRYFIYWGKNSETRGAFTQRFVDEANYLKSLPDTVQKFVFVNEEGTAVPYPDGLPMPAQTIIFLTQEKSEIKYFVRDPGLSFIVPKNTPAVFLPMAYDQKLFEQLEEKNPDGQIEKINDFSVFKINF